MALTITEANAVNVVLRELTGLTRDDGKTAGNAVIEAAALLAEHAHKVLGAGLHESSIHTSPWKYTIADRPGRGSAL